MRIAFRVDASSAIGTGHVRRCLSLADAIDARAGESLFVLRRHDKVADAVMASSRRGTSWLRVPQAVRAVNLHDPRHADWVGVAWQEDVAETIEALRDFAPNWLVVDHYGLDARWHAEVRAGLGCRILAIDDLGDRPLDADALLDANVADRDAKYLGRLVRKAKMLVGPSYALLSPVYLAAPRLQIAETVRSIGVFMGGTDPWGASEKVLAACRAAGFRGSIEVVTTSVSSRLSALRRACEADEDASLTLDLPDLSAFYGRHDLQIGAGGTSTYERCSIGAPTIALALAENQLAVVPILQEAKVLRSAVLLELPQAPRLANAAPLERVIRELIDDANLRRNLSERSRELVDARGAERVALAMLADDMTVRCAVNDDCVMLHEWRNHPGTREMSTHPEEITLANHRRWLAATIENADRALLIAEIGGQPIGSIRFDRIEGAAFEVSLYLDPGLHGLGLGPRMLIAGEEAIAGKFGQEAEFSASVLPGNLTSARLFQSSGYSGGPLRYTKTFNQKKTSS
jgi:UDP-2,4-diacetamido-2,4,6-trideoxy-beta-L-altropyranose hydrolase